MRKRFYSAVVQGMAVQVLGGATKTELRKLAKVSLRAWPVKKKDGAVNRLLLSKGFNNKVRDTWSQSHK